MKALYKYILLVIFLGLSRLLAAQSGQIVIPRVALMPDQPTPYNVRDWRDVAIKFDSFIYNQNATGQYLPLVSYNSNGQNYPSQKQIRLHTYVGTKSPLNSEAINVLPSLVGSALAGNDIRNMFGVDRLVMAQDFFNKTNGENMYLNNASAGSGGDWWYDVMPNVYFYQLYNLFPAFNSEADYQFISVADKFLEATRKMGGKAAPWSPASMNYRAWNFKTMVGNPNGVKEPETAGTFGWILYHAYKTNQNPEYLKGAEWSMEYLNSLTSNPSYELQLPYGAYIAAKMNAEVGTNYNTEKLVNWCFDRGPLRGWGTIVGKWGSFDVSGLVGEANDNGNDYAFLMNGMQQAAALVPMVRYDKRFATSIAKWMLNLSNASRLFYPGFLPSFLQDGATWSQAHDPNALIAHEAMREKFQNLSPYATGDAVGGGWGNTNLAIYGSSSVGYLGAIVSKTNVDRILRLDLNETDFYSDGAYPSYLYYNPFDTPRMVTLNVGDQRHQIYETISEKFILDDVTGEATLTILPKQAIMVVVTPYGGTIRYDKNKMLVDDIVVDYMQSKSAFTFAPRIKALEPENYIVEKGSTVRIFCTAEDKDSDTLTYKWFSDTGQITGDESEAILTLPENTGSSKVKVIVSDPEGNADSLELLLTVVDVINKAPVIHALSANTRYTTPQGEVLIKCIATDANGDNLTYTWTSNAGSITGSDSIILWNAPSAEGQYTITVSVDDGKGLSDVRSLTILVKNFDGDGQLIAWYPFTGNTLDISGNNHNGTNKGGLLTDDFDGIPNSAYFFNGGSQHIEVAATPKLNVTNAISVSLWCKPILTADKEIFLISHGSWQNRWKLSFTPEKNLRWTVNAVPQIIDLDNTFPLKSDSIYHIVSTYDGKDMLIYVNGKLDAFAKQSGPIRTTTLPLLIGQMLPSDANYNFRGVMDEIRIYDYAIHPDEVIHLYNKGISTGIKELWTQGQILVYPNPVPNILNIKSEKQHLLGSEISVFDIAGKLMFQTVSDDQNHVQLDVRMLNTGIYFLQIKAPEGEIIQSTQFIKS
ncbi:MAG: T9SS type A sorting domain-containing protein [Saprospiraceae bacterium]|nr:T9SS type A sorting domain-containing protein [Saprospiraceae bacterium]